MAQALSGAAAPYLAEQIHIMTTDPVTGNLNASANLMAHAVLGAVTAQLQDGSALAGAAGASAGEYIAQQLYPGVDKSKLSEEQKQSSSAGALSGAQAGKNAVENNALSLPAGMAAYGQAVASWNQYAEANGLTDAEKQAGLKKLAEGDMPEYANVTKVIVEGSTDGAILAGAWYLGPAATIWEVAASGTIGTIANGTYQWFDINSRENQSKPLNERKTWDYWSSGSAVVTGALAPGRGVWQNVGITVGSSVFTDGPDVGAVGGAIAGAGVGGAFGKYAPGLLEPVLGPSSGFLSDISGSVGGEIIGNKIKDKINGTGKQLDEK
ncbi:hypothetical protein BTJ39_23965 [Izhakiella australiensis]|uniref:VENN motif-containing domain-containing protein n=1 Tax=Izhakiella australiensis TaxID=1926881 RepID=A0A1S8Y4G7_9GAMM|nr:hypothetical protein BTJ39_23965 [Izhakiella australiensis]